MKNYSHLIFKSIAVLATLGLINLNGTQVKALELTPLIMDVEPEYGNLFMPSEPFQIKQANPEKGKVDALRHKLVASPTGDVRILAFVGHSENKGYLMIWSCENNKIPIYVNGGLNATPGYVLTQVKEGIFKEFTPAPTLRPLPDRHLPGSPDDRPKLKSTIEFLEKEEGDTEEDGIVERIRISYEIQLWPRKIEQANDDGTIEIKATYCVGKINLTWSGGVPLGVDERPQLYPHPIVAQRGLIRR